MPVTKGAGNPDWTEDETILALDLLLRRLPKAVPGPSDEEVIALSQLLRTLPVHDSAKKNSTFRNPDGVGLKLQNLNSVRTGKGLSSSRMDRKIWLQYGSKPDVLRDLAEKIRKASENPDASAPTEEETLEEVTFKEGKLLTRIHTRRERSPALRPLVLKAAKKLGPLTCSACEKKAYSHLGNASDAMFEVHHIKPLSTLTDENETRIIDVAILCADCHRLIHRLSSSEGLWYTPEMLKGLLKRA